ncbi:hypothetical protein TSUD_138970 [Trifolium subterraneum]|uniref:non-reducing end alpha-L-arabinofuranosidase n=1 Tax=Trifolium subterraneum TaxID=3900 RepID=A0A2Z6NY99_TRISU|nr:hypothetical protein TSUD_138970 [Trifolium subterraneum]
MDECRAARGRNRVLGCRAGASLYWACPLAEDLNALPIWVIYNGISHNEHVNISDISPLVQDALDGIEFARGSHSSKWGSIRASMGHPKPFDLRYVAVGNEDCPDIQIISNCDASEHPLNHSADFNIQDLPLICFTSYLKCLIMPQGLVQSDVVSMVTYAPLFVNVNDRAWNPDAIVFDSHQVYGTPSYWVIKLFKESSGSTLLNSNLQTSSPILLAASAISWKNSVDGKSTLRIKVGNMESKIVKIDISIERQTTFAPLFLEGRCLHRRGNILPLSSTPFLTDLDDMNLPLHWSSRRIFKHNGNILRRALSELLILRSS